MLRYIFATVMACALCTPRVWPQAVTATISGSVSDPSGGRVPGAKVTAVNTLTGQPHVATANEQGDYLFPVLPVGQYQVRAEAPGFKKFVRDGIVLTVNRNARLDAVLEVGEVNQEVRVTGDVPLVDTRQVQLGGLVDSQRVNELPLNGRNVYDLVSILPGVGRTRLTTVQDNDGNQVNVNGSRTRHSTFMLDGAFNNDLWRNSGNAAPNPDAVQEFRLLTSNFNAEFGRSPGAVINVVTKSGTNQFHASLFEFLRNSKLNARNFFRASVDPLRQNQYGASAGGRIVRDKTFFFASYESLRIRSSAFTNSALTPTAAERRGDFSANKQLPRDPVTKQPYPGGMIPLSAFDPAAAKIAALLVPLPNTADGRLEAGAANKADSNQVLAKIDHQLTSAHKLYGTLFIVQSMTNDPFAGQLPGYGPMDRPLNQRNLVVSEDWVASPSTLNQFRFSYTRRFADRIGSVRTSWPEFGSQVTLGSTPPRPPQMFITGRWNMGYSGEGFFSNQSYGWSDTLTRVHGNHSLKAGTWLLYNRYAELGTWLGPGQVRFSNSFTGNVLSDFFLGRANSFRQNNGTDRKFRSKNLHNFLQDDWKIHRKLTLNLGLRYEFDFPWINTTDELQTFRFGKASTTIPKAPLGLQFPGDPGIPRGVAGLDRNNLAPRIGLAYDLSGDGKTAIRAGYGVFYAIGFANFVSDMQGQPFLVDVTIFGTQNLVNPYAAVPGGSPFPYKLDRSNPRFTLPVTASYLSENYATPYVQHYNFTIERQLSGNLGLQLAYVGNTSRKLVVQRDANAPLLIPGRSTAANVNDRRPYLPASFAQIAQTETASNAHYDSLQATLTRRFANRFSIMGSYTLGKAIDEISDDKFNPTAVAMVDSNNRRLDRAPSSLDTRHIAVVSYVWELPDVRHYGWLGSKVLSGWQLNGIAKLQSGNPLNVVSGRDTNLDGNNNDRPDLVGEPRLSADRPRAERIARWYNLGAFRTASDGANGSAGRNLIYGPGLFSCDTSLFKNIAISENHRLQVRGEFFNLFNRVSLGDPDLTLSSANAGRILSAGPARVVQFGLKYAF